MESISLRSITVLLNYELMISDPRFKDTELIISSFADPQESETFKTLNPKFVKDQPESVRQLNLHLFEKLAEPSAVEHPSTIVDLHPNAEPLSGNLTFAQRELIFLESRNHSGCFKAAGMYQMFFKLCNPDHKLLIRIKDEEPLLVDFNACEFLKINMHNPKLHTLSSVRGTPGYTAATGGMNDEQHIVMIIPHPTMPREGFVVDMTRMQYGEAARGPYGENYFLGTDAEFLMSLKEICDGPKDMVKAMITEGEVGTVEAYERVLRLENCAKRAFERWQNREKQGWCEHCGKGGKLMKCGACKTKAVWYCCKEHQKAGWKLHKWTCEKPKVEK
ncbi:hypothetical protein DL98DRAFT_609844 [Cadophora sp. DSE1049]|nr:hypothetical protein DL98DRAFT_609844 [Cadophora sp. DSE1049]